MSHKDMAKALALLVLENDDLYGDLIKVGDERDAAQARADASASKLCELHAEVHELRRELRATRNSGFPVDARDWPLGCGVPVPQPEIAGKVLSEHGACTDGGEPVWAVVTHDLDDLLPTQRQTYIALRLKAGEDKYGTPLRVGWSRAREALEEEFADGIAYAVALERRDLVAALAQVWDLLTWGEE